LSKFGQISGGIEEKSCTPSLFNLWKSYHPTFAGNQLHIIDSSLASGTVNGDRASVGPIDIVDWSLSVIQSTSLPIKTSSTVPGNECRYMPMGGNTPPST